MNEPVSGLEIERKLLIRMPDKNYLHSLENAEIWDIVQTYLTDGNSGETRRVRRVLSGGKTSFIYNEKRRMQGISHAESEWTVDEAEYEKLLEQAHPDCTPIIKRRYRYPYHGQTLELDVYAFWNDRATLEIELERESQPIYLPDEISVIRDVSTESAYKNRRMAECVPMEELK